MKIATVLTPCPIAEECFLSEALAWIAFNRFPLFESPNGEGDMRFHHDYQEEYEPSLPSVETPDNDECSRAGLPANPEFEVLMNGEYFPSPETSESFLNLPGIDEKQKAEFREDIKRAYDYQKKKDAWTEKYEAFIEVPKSKLFLALREGKLQAQGRLLPKSNLDEAIEEMDKLGSWSWTDLEPEPIPAGFWRQKAVKWEESAAETENVHYMHIHVNTAQLMALFPPPPAEDAKSVSLVAGSYILDEAAPTKITKTGKRGRPAENWDTFHLEMFDRLKTNNIPEKQEAFIQDMQAWCLKNWGKEPGRSTLLQKISPFYDRFIRKKSENRDA